MVVKSIDRPAILGGNPVFTDPLPFNCPTLSPPQELAEQLAIVLESGRLTNDLRVAQLEKRASELIGRPTAALSSCTSALMLAYKLLGLRGKAIVPSFTFFATSHALLWNNVEPLFVDVKRDTWTLDPKAVESAITDDVSAIIGVDVFGNPCDKEELALIAKRHGLRLITDAAHSLGGEYQGRPVGGFGDAEVFSMSPTKLAVAGEGGLISGADGDFIARIREGRDYGNGGDYDCRFVGLNARMSELHAVVALASLSRLGEHVRARRRIARRFQENLQHLPGLAWQKVEPGNQSTYKDVAALVDSDIFGLSRDEVRAALAAEGIPTRTYFDPPAHRQQAYTGCVSLGSDLMETNRISANILCFPVFSHMENDQIDKVCAAVDRIHRHGREISEEAKASMPEC